MTEEPTLDKLKMHSPDLSQDNIAKIRELFPGCVTEARDEATGKLRLAVDFDQLRQELSDHIVDGPQERYRLDWPGKREVQALANAPIAKTMRPCPDESSKFDDTQNLFIEGDNLDALKLLQETYLGKVKMIYIDPPYNTGKDFIYEDDFFEDAEEFLVRSNQRNDEGLPLVSNSELNGRFHSDWLSMIYPRLKLARNILSEDGLIFVSIDDNESGNLKKVLDEVFGEENLLSVHHIQVRYGNKSLNERKDFQELLETIYIYAKNKASVRLNKPKIKYPIEKFDLEVNHNETPDLTIEKRGRKMDVWKKGSFQINKVAPSIDGFKETWISGSILTGTGHGLMYSSMIDDRVDEDGNGCLYRIHGVGEDGLGYRYYTNPVDEKASRGKMLTKVPLSKREMLLNGNATKDLPILNFYDFSGDFGNIRHEGGVPFNAGKKPIKLLRQLINYFPDKDMTILDFFAGSASTAHAAIAQNAEDGGSRKFMLVQLPEPIDPKDKVVAKICDDIGCERLISEVGKERIRRAGKKILEDECHPAWNRDAGFRVLKVDTSNMKDFYYRPDELKQSDLLDMVDNVKEDRTGEDLLFQVLVDWGVDLTLPVRREIVQGRTVFFVDDNALVACFDKGITEDFVKELAGHQPLRVVFRDNGFVSDAVKINGEQVFRQLSPTTEMKSI